MVNVGAKPIEVKLEIVDVGENRVAFADELTIAPGAADLSDSFDVAITGYCRFSRAFGRREVRASMGVFSGERTILVTPAE